MISSSMDRNRKEKTLEAHKMLLKLDEADISGSITFHFAKGAGIVQSEVRDVRKWNNTTSENKVIDFSSKM